MAHAEGPPDLRQRPVRGPFLLETLQRELFWAAVADTEARGHRIPAPAHPEIREAIARLYGMFQAIAPEERRRWQVGGADAPPALRSARLWERTALFDVGLKCAAEGPYALWIGPPGRADAGDRWPRWVAGFVPATMEALVGPAPPG